MRNYSAAMSPPSPAKNRLSKTRSWIIFPTSSVVFPIIHAYYLLVSHGITLSSNTIPICPHLPQQQRQPNSSILLFHTPPPRHLLDINRLKAYRKTYKISFLVRMPFAQLVLGSPGAGKSTYCNGSTFSRPVLRCHINKLTFYSAAVHVSYRTEVLCCESRSSKRSEKLSMCNRCARSNQAGRDHGRGSSWT